MEFHYRPNFCDDCIEGCISLGEKEEEEKKEEEEQEEQKDILVFFQYNYNDTSSCMDGVMA